MTDLVGGVRGSVDQRVASIMKGVASVIFGVLALAWPDVTLLVVAVVPATGLVSQRFFYAETSGVTADRLTPRIADTAKIIAAIYAVLTAAGFVAYRLAVPKDGVPAEEPESAKTKAPRKTKRNPNR
mgnify:CR=1 FL=1